MAAFYIATTRKTYRVIILFLVFIMLAYSKLFEKNSIYYLMATAILATVSLGVAIFLPYYLARQSLKDNMFLRREVAFEVSDSGFKYVTYNSSIMLEWKDVYGYFKDKKLFVVYISKQQALMIPKRVLEDDEITNLDLVLKSNSKKR